MNAKKTKSMLFGLNNCSVPLPFPLKIQGVSIERIGYRFPVKSFKLVRVMLDDFLNRGEHTKYIRGKLNIINYINYSLARAKRILPTFTGVNIIVVG